MNTMDVGGFGQPTKVEIGMRSSSPCAGGESARQAVRERVEDRDGTEDKE